MRRSTLAGEWQLWDDLPIRSSSSPIVFAERGSTVKTYRRVSTGRDPPSYPQDKRSPGGGFQCRSMVRLIYSWTVARERVNRSSDVSSGSPSSGHGDETVEGGGKKLRAIKLRANLGRSPKKGERWSRVFQLKALPEIISCKALLYVTGDG